MLLTDTSQKCLEGMIDELLVNKAAHVQGRSQICDCECHTRSIAEETSGNRGNYHEV